MSPQKMFDPIVYILNALNSCTNRKVAARQTLFAFYFLGVFKKCAAMTNAHCPFKRICWFNSFFKNIFRILVEKVLS